jgi:hypothetical protein
MAQAFWKTVWQFLKKLKIGLPREAVILFLGIYSQRIKK